jgi:hypothetical protein
VNQQIANRELTGYIRIRHGECRQLVEDRLVPLDVALLDQ